MLLRSWIQHGDDVRLQMRRAACNNAVSGGLLPFVALEQVQGPFFHFPRALVLEAFGASWACGAFESAGIAWHVGFSAVWNSVFNGLSHREDTSVHSSEQCPMT